MKYYNLKSNTCNLEKGFSLFIAIVIMGALLLVAYAVSNLAAKEFSFTNSNRNSEYAFFAADAGVECALYWDSKTDAFSTTTGNLTNTINCGNTAIFTASQSVPTVPSASTSQIGGGGDSTPNIFYFPLNDGANHVDSCVVVTVKKYYDGPLHNGNFITEIYSKGYDTCDTSNNRRVERGIQVRY